MASSGLCAGGGEFGSGLPAKKRSSSLTLSRDSLRWLDRWRTNHPTSWSGWSSITRMSMLRSPEDKPARRAFFGGHAR